MNDEKLQYSQLRTEEKFGDVFERLQNLKSEIENDQERIRVNKMEIYENRSNIDGLNENLTNTK